MEHIVLAFVSFVLATSCVAGCGEDSSRVYSVRQRRDRLSENVVIGLDYLGKPKIVCHCDAEGVQRLTSKSILASRRHDVVRVKAESLKTGLNKRDVEANRTELEQNEADLMYSPTCCKIDLTNPRKLYTYPFTLRLPDKTFTEKLKDRTSKEYQDLKNELLPALTTLLANEGCVVQIEIKGFRKGSVLADVGLTVLGIISQTIIDTLKSAIESGNIGGVRVEIVPELPPDEMPTTTPKPTTPKPTTPKPGTTVPPLTTPKTTPPDNGQKFRDATTPKPTTPKPTTAKPTPTTEVVGTIAPTNTTPKAATTTPKPPTTTPKPPTTPAPVITPEKPIDARPTIPYATNTPGKEFEAAITFPEKSFDPNLNIPSSAQYLELKKMIEQSLKDIYTGNPDFLSVTVLRFRPAAYKPPKASSPTGTATATRRSGVPSKPGIEVTLDFKFRTAKPGLLMPLESQLKVGTIASHVVSPDMAAVIINDEPQVPGNTGPGNTGPGNTGPGNIGLGNSGQTCPSTCQQPNVCFPLCAERCCSPPQVPSCPIPCSSKCAPSCTSSCCTLTKRSYQPSY